MRINQFQFWSVTVGFWLRERLLEIGMATQAQLAGTDPTLMGRVLLGPIKNRVKYGFFFKKKKKPEAGLGWVWILSKLGPNPTQLHMKLLKYPYIYI